MICLIQVHKFTCDLSIFPNEQVDINQGDFKFKPEFDMMGDQNGKLSLFTNHKECQEQKECDKSKIDKKSFCHDHCTIRLSEFLENGDFQKHCYQSEKYEKNETSKESLMNSTTENTESKHLLNAEGFLYYYKLFVRSLLDELNHEELTNDQSNFDVKLILSMHDINKLKQFANSLNNTEASTSIVDATDILRNMFSHVQYFQPEKLTESISKVVISVALDPRVQIALFLVIIVTTIGSVLLNQLCKNKLSIKSLIVSLLMLMFIISVINNHFLIIQKNQILKNQRLNEKIPDECFGSSMQLSKEEENNQDIFSSTMSQLKGYFKLKPTSQVCLEYQEALLLDGKYANFMETIIYTITESIRPVSVLFGESINLFYSSLTKNLSFYQYMPLMAGVTVVIVPIAIYMMSLLSLVIFGYEFNFFHLISFKKSASAEKTNEIAQQTELLKILSVLKKENEIIANNMIQSRCQTEQQHQAIKALPQTFDRLTMSTHSDIETVHKQETSKPIDDSQYIEKKPDPYYTEPILEEERPAGETSLNESVCEEVVKYLNNSSKCQSKLQEKNEILAYENKKLKEMIFYQKANESINEEENKENRVHVSTPLSEQYNRSNTVVIGGSKSVKKCGSVRSLKNSFIKDISDTDFGDDDEDILVILDEK